MKLPKEWLDEFRYRKATVSNAAELEREYLLQYDTIIRDVLNAAVKACPPRTGIKSQFYADYEQGCRHYKEEILKLLHTLPEIK